MPSKKPISQAAIDDLIRKNKGKNAVEAENLKNCMNPKYHRYQFVGLSDGSVLNLNLEAMTAHTLPANSMTAKMWRLRQARAVKRLDAKKAKLDKAEAKKAARKAEAK
jgi:predicted secreted protein